MKIRKYDIWMISIILVVGFLSWYTNYMRTQDGFFSSPNWIFLDGVMYTIFSALIVGYVVAKLIKHSNGYHIRKR